MRLAAAIPSWTPTAVADTTNFTDNGHQTIQGGVAGGTTAGQRSELREVYLGGQATASAPAYMLLGRTSTVGATLTALRLAPLDASSVLIANPPTHYAVSTTKPQRSATLGALLNLSYNAFGGIVRWYCGPDEVISMLGTSTIGELSLNGFTGSSASALMGTNIVIETV
jgi:hypothetical protein